MTQIVKEGDDYFSGQGVVMVGLRTSAGKPKNLRPIGNVSALAIRNETSTLEHKESTSGQRATDLRLDTENKVSLSITLEDFNSENLALALRGTATESVAGTETDDPIEVYFGYVTPLDKIKLSAVTVKQGAANTLAAYVNDTTNWDYKLNADGGSIQLNDDLATVSNMGLVPTAIAVGATTSYTVPTGHLFAVGDKVVPRGFTGADAADVNGVEQTVTAVAATTVTTSLNTTGKTITTAAGSRFVNKTGAMSATATYTYEAQHEIGSYTEGAKELYMHFEGLNTANGNSPVVVDVFRYRLDPAQELALISDGVQAFTMEGSCLSDSLQPTGSKFYRIRKINKTA